MKRVFIILAVSTMLLFGGCTYSDSNDSCPCGVNCADELYGIEDLYERVEYLEQRVDELEGYIWDIERGLY